MLLSNIRDEVAGRFRNKDEWVGVGAHIGADPLAIEGLLTAMLTTYHTTVHEHVVKRIATLHLTFEHIHPFVDGNKRTAFVATQLFLMLNGFRLAASDPEHVLTILALAAGEISEAEFAAWVRNHITKR
jgi:death-on-curing family protein